MSAFEQIEHGRYLIKVGPLAGGWAAQAFIGQKTAGSRQTGASRDEVIGRTLQMLEERDAQIVAGRGADGSPSVTEYVEAFGRLGRLAASYEAMLDAHLAAQGNRITATQLASAAGYENFNAANLHYGRLGQMLAEELAFNPPKRSDGTVIWTAAIATWDEDPELADATGHFVWVMRPQVVEALSGRT